MEAEETRKRIGVAIRKLREEKGMFQSDLSAASGIARSRISEIERGQYSAGVDVLALILGGLGAHLDVVAEENQ